MHNVELFPFPFLSLRRGRSGLFCLPDNAWRWARSSRFDERFLKNMSSGLRGRSEIYVECSVGCYIKHKQTKKQRNKKKITQHSQNSKECRRQYINTFTIATTSSFKNIRRSIQNNISQHLKYIIIQRDGHSMAKKIIMIHDVKYTLLICLFFFPFSSFTRFLSDVTASYSLEGLLVGKCIAK